MDIVIPIIVGIVGLIIGYLINTVENKWNRSLQQSEINRLKAKISDIEKLEKDNIEYARLIKQIVLQYGVVDGDWKGYDYEMLKLEIDNFEFLVVSKYNWFEASSKCIRVKEDGVRVSPPYTILLKANRNKVK